MANGMGKKTFRRVFGRVVEKATRRQVTKVEIDDFRLFDYFDADMPVEVNVDMARFAAVEFLRENGWAHDGDMTELVRDALDECLV